MVHPNTAPSATPPSRQELKRKLESAEDSDIVEQGKMTLKSVKKELRLLQKAEEEQNQGEGARSLPPPVHLAPATHTRPGSSRSVHHPTHPLRRRCRGHGREAG